MAVREADGVSGSHSNINDCAMSSDGWPSSFQEVRNAAALALKGEGGGLGFCFRASSLCSMNCFMTFTALSLTSFLERSGQLRHRCSNDPQPQHSKGLDELVAFFRASSAMLALTEHLRR